MHCRSLFFVLFFLSAFAWGETLRSLGTATPTRSNYNCNRTDKCYDLEVTCPGVTSMLKATVYVKVPVTMNKGTIVFHSGAKGTGLWSSSSTYAASAITELYNLGYQTVQIKWAGDWLAGNSVTREGISALACRPATVLSWINNNLNTPGKPLCATGNSGGAIQLSYAISDYGLNSQIKQAVITSGPSSSRLDNGCMDAVTSPLYMINQTDVVDRSYGYQGKNGACSLKDATFLNRFVADSIALGDERRYLYPETRIDIFVGSLDTTTATIAQSQIFYDRLVAAENPKVSYEVVLGVDHSVHAWEAGVTKIKNTLIAGCL